MSGTLTITTDPPNLAVSVLDRNLKLVTQAVSPASIATLSEGEYILQASRPQAPDLVAVARVVEGSKRFIHLSDAAPTLLSRITPSFRSAAVATSPLSPARIDPEPAPGSTSSVLSATVSEWKPVAIRFAWLYDWSVMQLIRPPDFSTRFEPGQAVVAVSNPYPRVVFAQVSVDRANPINVALPPAGFSGPTRCELIVAQSDGEASTRVRLLTPWADSALQYLAEGYLEQAKRVIDTAALEQPGGRFGWRFRLEDPIAALVRRYLQVRMGAPEDWDSRLANWLDEAPGSSDSLILAVEVAARKGDDSTAMHKLARIREGALPVFTEGFTLLVSRLRMFERQEGAAQLAALRERISVWTRYIDLANPTLTFPGEDLAAPKSRSEARDRTEKDGWHVLAESRFFSLPGSSATEIPKKVDPKDVAQTALLLQIDRFTLACTEQYRAYRRWQTALTVASLTVPLGVTAAGVYHHPEWVTILGAVTTALIGLDRYLQLGHRTLVYRLLISEARDLATRAKNSRLTLREQVRRLNRLIERQALT
jgi:hypothetical protein